MALNLFRQGDSNAQPAADLVEDARRFDPSSSLSATRGTTVIDLVNRAVETVQTIEDRATQTMARAHELARHAAEQLTAMQAALEEANARTCEAEERMRLTEARMADMEERLADAEERTSHAEARAIDAEHIVIRVENAIQCQLLEKLQPSASRLAAAA